MRPLSNALTARGTSPGGELPLRLIDLGLLAVIFLAPLFMGGRGPIGKLVFVSIVGLTMVGWTVAQCRQAAGGTWQRSGVAWLLMAGVTLVVAQLIPLPPNLLARISPSLSELLPLWTSSGPAAVHLGQWSTVSLTPEATRGALIVLVAYIMLFLLVVQRIQSLDDVGRILGWIAQGTVALAVLGLLQFLVGNGKFLWVFEHPSRDTFHSVKGPFHNQNHFAHTLALGMGPLIWTWLRAPAKSLQKHLFGVGLGLVVVAGLLTFSRGGVLSILIAGGATVALYSWKELLDKRTLAFAGLSGLVVVGALMIHGYGPLSRKFAALRNAESLDEAAGARADLWAALLEGIPQFAWLGSGIGSHRDVYPLFMEEHYGVEFTHGENGYLPLALEGGIPALLLLLTGITICFWWCYRAFVLPAPAHINDTVPERPSATRQRAQQPELLGVAACTGAVLPGLLVSVLHSFADFVWYISTCMALSVILAACACRLHQLAREQSTRNTEGDPTRQASSRYQIRLPQPAWGGIAMIAVVATFGMIHDRHRSALAAPHWYAFRKLDLPNADRIIPEEAIERDLLSQFAAQLEQALQRDPENPQINLRYAGTCLRRFELEQRHAINPMALQQIREAALASKFPTRQAQEQWLALAVGENKHLLDLALKHCHRALRGSPLQGDGYIYLAELCFLEGPSATAKNAYIDQASRVRPNSSGVAFVVGLERALVHDVDGLLKYGRKAFRQDPRVRLMIIEKFSQILPGEVFIQHFQADIEALRKLKTNYQRIGQTDDAQAIARHLASELASQLMNAASPADRPGNARVWFELQGLHDFLQDHPAALQCAQRAVELDAANFDYRSTLANLLLQGQDYSAAIDELQWCLRRKPDDARLMAQLTEANRGRLRQRTATAAPSVKRF